MLKDIVYNVRSPNKRDPLGDYEPKNLQTLYQERALEIQEVSLNEYSSSKDELKFNRINILKTNMILSLQDCLFKNHPLYTDQNIHLLIPLFNLNIDANAVLFLETIKLLSIQDPKTQITVISEPSYAHRGDLTVGISQCKIYFLLCL